MVQAANCSHCPSELGVIAQVGFDVGEQRGRDHQGAGGDALAGGLERADLELPLVLLHGLVDLEQGDLAGQGEVAALQGADLAGAQSQHPTDQDAEAPGCGHGVGDPVEDVEREWVLVAFAGGLGAGSVLDPHRVDVDQLFLHSGVQDRAKQVIGLPRRRLAGLHGQAAPPGADAAAGQLSDPDVADAVVDDRLALHHAAASDRGGFADDVELQQLGVALAGSAGEVVPLHVLGAVAGDRGDRLGGLACGLDSGPFVLLGADALVWGSPLIALDQPALAVDPRPGVALGLEGLGRGEADPLLDAPDAAVDVARLVPSTAFSGDLADGSPGALRACHLAPECRSRFSRTALSLR